MNTFKSCIELVCKTRNQLFLLLFSLLMISCQKEQQKLSVAEQDFETHVRKNPCEPSGDFCDDLGDQTQNYLYQGCMVTVTMHVTRCLVNGEVVYYFEDEGQQVTTSSI